LAQTIFRVDEDNLFWSTRPNRSLTVNGRLLWLLLIALNAVMVSAIALAIGAWPVVPFAGLEVFLVAVAFAVMAHHDHDFELLEVSRGEFRWESRYGARADMLRGNLAWLQVERCSVGPGNQFCLRLRYAGKDVLLGRGLDLRMLNQMACRLVVTPVPGWTLVPGARVA
jgi:uncharacterized membrane protein